MDVYEGLLHPLYAKAGSMGYIYGLIRHETARCIFHNILSYIMKREIERVSEHNHAGKGIMYRHEIRK